MTTIDRFIKAIVAQDFKALDTADLAALATGLELLKTRFKLYFCESDTAALGGPNELVGGFADRDVAIRRGEEMTDGNDGWARVVDGLDDSVVWTNDGDFAITSTCESMVSF